LRADSGTNISGGLDAAAMLLQQETVIGTKVAVLLTDGQPSGEFLIVCWRVFSLCVTTIIAGISHPPDLRAHINDKAKSKFSVFPLAFGFDVSIDLLKDIAGRLFCCCYLVIIN
jgi:Mg-chelatase subunit ChlD